jgi:hypothetical protein
MHRLSVQSQVTDTSLPVFQGKRATAVSSVNLGVVVQADNLFKSSLKTNAEHSGGKISETTRV